MRMEQKMRPQRKEQSTQDYAAVVQSTPNIQKRTEYKYKYRDI
jgi:hypothetical protein